MPSTQPAGGEDRAGPPERFPAYMSVRQVADYLQLNVKKVYTLLGEGKIPGTRITGKWLFPRHLIDQWLVEASHGGVLTDRLILLGSDDPLLHRLVASLTAEMGDKALIVYTPTGTRLGLELLARGRANACTLHWGPVSESRHRHPALIRHYPQHPLWVLIRLFRREQGLMVSPRLGAGQDGLQDLLRADLRWVLRQEGAGSLRFLQETLSAHGLASRDLRVGQRARSEREAASLIAMGIADIAPGVRGGATEFGLDFVPTGWEAFDLALYREVYFRTLFQRLLDHLKARPSHNLAGVLGGYDLSQLGEVVWAG
jgi:putative molybdopterin biosynthesis protein